VYAGSIPAPASKFLAASSNSSRYFFGKMGKRLLPTPTRLKIQNGCL